MTHIHLTHDEDAAYAITMKTQSAVQNPSCWVVTDGSAGMEIQCIGLAEAMGLEFEVKRIVTTKPWRWLPPKFWLNPLKTLDKSGDLLNPPWPDVLITCGRQSIPLSLAIKKANGDKTFTIHIQTPNCDAQATLDADLRTEDAAFRVFYALFTAAMVALALWLHFEWYAKIAPAAEAVVEADAAVRSASFPPAAAQRWS